MGLGEAAPPWDPAAPAPSQHAQAQEGAAGLGRLPQACSGLQSCQQCLRASSPSFSGVGLGFLFSWLLILLVFATFLVGGNIQTLVCRNWVNQEIYKVGSHASVHHSIHVCLGTPRCLQMPPLLEPCLESLILNQNIKIRIRPLDLQQEREIGFVLVNLFGVTTLPPSPLSPGCLGTLGVDGVL